MLLRPVGRVFVEEDEWTDDDDLPCPVGDQEEVAEDERPVETARPRPGRRPGPGMRVTPADVAVLQFLTRYRYATYAQIAGYVGREEATLRQRFRRLKRAGLVVGENSGVTAKTVWLPTPLGVRFSGLDLPTPTVSPATATHTLGLVDLGMRFEAAGETVVTEREIRAADTRERPTARMLAARRFYGDERAASGADNRSTRFVVHLGAGDGQYIHVPDMVLARPPLPDGAPQSVAIELELRRKPPTQWRKILRAYRDSQAIGYTIYYTHRRDIRDGIQRAANELGMTDQIEVRKFTPAD